MILGSPGSGSDLPHLDPSLHCPRIPVNQPKEDPEH